MRRRKEETSSALPCPETVFRPARARSYPASPEIAGRRPGLVCAHFPPTQTCSSGGSDKLGARTSNRPASPKVSAARRSGAAVHAVAPTPTHRRSTCGGVTTSGSVSLAARYSAICARSESAKCRLSGETAAPAPPDGRSAGPEPARAFRPRTAGWVANPESFRNEHGPSHPPAKRTADGDVEGSQDPSRHLIPDVKLARALGRAAS